MGTLEEWRSYKKILDFFCLVSGMNISYTKSLFLKHTFVAEVERSISVILPLQFIDMNGGTKYLGYFVKPTNYLLNDWYWLVRRFEQRIGHWSMRQLSLGGRLTLAKAVLQNLGVYWFSLCKIPKTILRIIR